MKHLQDNNTLEALDKPKNKINASKLFNIETDLDQAFNVNYNKNNI